MFTEWRIENNGVGLSEWKQGKPPEGLAEILLPRTVIKQRESTDTVNVKRAVLAELWEYYVSHRMVSTQSEIGVEMIKVLGLEL